GTLYQYFPHKEALLFALVNKQVTSIAQVMEDAVARLAGKPLAAIAEGLAEAWLDAKTADIVGARAVYGIAAEFDIAEMVKVETRRLELAVEAVLATPCDVMVGRRRAAAFTLLA